MRIAFTTFGSHLQVGFWRNVFASLNHPLTPTESYEEGQVAPQGLSACREAAQFNKSLQPTPVGAGSSAFAGHVTGPAWLSLGRSVIASYNAQRWLAEWHE
jgi:hypothetical protein